MFDQLSDLQKKVNFLLPLKLNVEINQMGLIFSTDFLGRITAGNKSSFEEKGME